jgi:UDP:flavonoid glycosyltransferase YjiC (YdhE family)
VVLDEPLDRALERPSAELRIEASIVASVSRIIVAATAGAGGDLQPLVAAALALGTRGHEVELLGDRSVERAVSGLGMSVKALAPELDLGPALIDAIRDAMSATGGDHAAAGPIVQQRMTTWAEAVARPVIEILRSDPPDAVVTSLFGVEVLNLVSPSCPWAVVNSTFYVGPNPPRPLEEDFGPRAVPLIARFASLLGSADLVLHATDTVFDLSLGRLPEGHHYVGPLGIWEPPSEAPAYLNEPGDPWVLVSISSQMQDDVPLAQAALAALEGKPVRAVVTMGPGHDPSEVTARHSSMRVEQLISHAAVLERGVLLLSHAGHGSVMKALWFGRPMVLVPWGRDQPGVAARAAALGVAAVVPRERASAETLSAAVDSTLADEEMRATSAWHGERLRTTDPPASAAELIEQLV